MINTDLMLWKLKILVLSISVSQSDAILSCLSHTGLCSMPVLGFLWDAFLVGFLQNFWKQFFFPNPMYLLPKAGHLLGSCAILWYWHLLLVTLHELLMSEFSLYAFMFPIMSKSLFFLMLVSMAFWAPCASSIFAQMNTCSLVMSLALYTVVSLLTISAVITYYIYKLLLKLPVMLLIFTLICLDS